MFRLHFYRSPKSLRFKNQSAKQKFIYLKSTTGFLEQQVNAQDEMVRELLERVSRLEVELLPKCNYCGQRLPKKECC